MDGEMELELENPVLYLKRRARKALESKGVILPPPPLRRPPRPFYYRPESDQLPQGVVNARHRIVPIGLDIICSNCEGDIPKSTRLYVICHFYSPDGTQGSPLTRCSVNCPTCSDNLVLGRNIGDADNFVVISGATQNFLSAEAVAYPDADVDSTDDFVPRYTPCGWLRLNDG